MVFTGDLLPADRQHTVGVGISSKIKKNDALLWSENIVSLFKSANITVINLEGPILEDSESVFPKSFIGNPDILNHLSISNITHANIANNHILEHDVSGFLNTKSLLQSVNIIPIGYVKDREPVIINSTINNISISISGLNGIHDISNQDCYAELSEKAIENIFENPYMQNADIKVLILHWGHEYIHIPSWEQIRLARYAIDKGFHMIVGHHPHVVQPVEEYKNGLICYSLGNFLFDMRWNYSVRTGAILNVDVSKNGIESWKIHSCRYNHHYFVDLVHDNWLEKRMIKWGKQMDNLQENGEKHYKEKFSKKAKRKKNITRIMMKLQLILQLPQIPPGERKVIFQSLLSKFSKKINSTLTD